MKFNLLPFEPLPSGMRDLKIQVQMQVIQQAISAKSSQDFTEFNFYVSGPIDQIHLAGAVDRTFFCQEDQQRDDLWKKTCFEVFLSPVGGQDYLELNLSPDGFWNQYYFESYRNKSDPAQISARGGQKKAGLVGFFSAAEVTYLRRSDSVEIKVRRPVGMLREIADQFSCGMTCVIKSADGHLCYFAMKHSSEKPDFHRASDWIGQLNV